MIKLAGAALRTSMYCALAAGCGEDGPGKADTSVADTAVTGDTSPATETADTLATDADDATTAADSVVTTDTSTDTSTVDVTDTTVADTRDTTVADTADTSGCDPTVRTFAVPDFSVPFQFAQRSVPPAAIDPASGGYPQAKHELYLATDADIPLRDELFVMLPGTDNHPSAFTKILEIAARAGYPSVGLAYDTSIAAQAACASITELDALIACRDGFYVEKITGVDANPTIQIDEPNSITGRLLRLLKALHAEFPSFGFDKHFSGNTVIWDKIVVAGFSQGAGMAGYIGKLHELARNIFFAGGCDAQTDLDGNLILAPWCYDERATPAERTYAVMHTDDEPEEDDLILRTFGLVALGGYADAGTQSPSYCTSAHALQTSLLDQHGGHKSHLSVAHDSEIPLDANGVPLLAEDYYYLMTAD